jgi:integrase
MGKLIKRTVDAVTPRAKAYIEWDSDITGFGLRVLPSGIKSFVIEYRPGAGGRSVNKRKLTLGRYGRMTVEQARASALNILARIRLGADPQDEKTRQRSAPTVSALINIFLADHVETRCKASTAESHKIALARLRAEHGAAKAQNLSRSQLTVLHREMRDRPYAANRFLAVIAALYAWAEREGYLPDSHVNPAKHIVKYREQRRERFLTHEELARLGEALGEGETIGLPYEIDESKPTVKHGPKAGNRRVVLDPFAAAAVRLLILTGARLREILHAKWEQVDFQRGLLFLSDSKTGRKPIYLNAPALEVFASLPRVEGNPHVIAGMKDGAPRADLKKPWAAITKAARLDGVRIHDLRHSHASVGAEAGLSLPVIGKLLGHSQPSTTSRYSHLAHDPVREASERIGAVISAALNGRKPGGVVPLAKLKK